MTAMQLFYLDRAAEARSQAASASLANIRERHLVAEITWSGLAARAGRVGTMQTRLAGEACAPFASAPRS